MLHVRCPFESVEVQAFMSVQVYVCKDNCFFFCLFQFFILDWQNMSQLTNDDVLENIWVDAGDEKHIEILFSDSEFDSDNYVVEDGESEKDMAR